QPISLPPLPPGTTLPPDIPNRPLTAAEAARIALAHQPSLTVAQANILAAKGVTQQTRPALLPSADVGANYEKVGNLRSATGGGGAAGSTATGYAATATLRQLIFDFNHTRDLVRQSEAEERASVANLSRTQSDLVLQVKQQFYTYSE